MTQQDFLATIHEFTAKKARMLPVCCDVQGKRFFVTVADERKPDTQKVREILLEVTETFEDTAGIINDLMPFYNSPGATILIEVASALREIQSVSLETKNFLNIPNWQECVLIEIA